MSRTRRSAQVGERGATSSRAQSSRSVWDRERFGSRENARWYEERKNNALVLEKTVSEEVDHIFGIRRAFDVLGWAPVLDLAGRYYPRLVREFYANIENKDIGGIDRVVSHVKGSRIELDRDSLSRILGVSNEGPSVEFSKDATLSDRQYTLMNALVRLDYFATRNNQTGDMVFRTPNMVIQQRLLVYLYSSNVIPRASSLNEVRCSDIYLLDKMLHGLQGVEGVPFASIVLSHIRSTVRSKRGAKSLCYPLLLTKVFEFYGVDVTGEDIAVPGPADMLTAANLYRMGYVRVHGVWRNLVRDPLGPGEVADARNVPVVEGDDEEEHSEAPIPSELPSASTGAPVRCSSNSSVASALQRIEDICTGLATRQDAIEAQLQ